MTDLDTRLAELQAVLLERSRNGEDYEDLRKEIDRLQEAKYRLQIKSAEKERSHSRVQEMKKLLEDVEVTEYSEDLVRKLIEKITVYDDKCDVEFKSGIIVEVYV